MSNSTGIVSLYNAYDIDKSDGCKIIGRYQFVNIESMDKNDQESFTKYLEGKNRPVRKEPEFHNIAYTWDYFKWLREKEYNDKQVRSINKKGIGYCGACGMFVKFTHKELQWFCEKCGYKNSKINDVNYKR